MSIVGALPFTLQNGTTADATQVMADFNSIKTDTNANAAANGANNDITSLAGLTTPLSIAQGGSGSATPAPFVFTGGYRNIARRNGGLEIWQRGAGGTASFAVGAGTTAYTADGWYLNPNTNEASVVSQQAGLTNGSQWSVKVLRNSGQTGTGNSFFGFPFDTDELYPVLGQYVRLSFTAKAGANWSPASGTLSFALKVGTGTPVKYVVGYTGETTPIVGSTNLTTSAARVQATSSVVILTTTRQMEILFFWTPVGTAGVDDSFYIDDVQLEIVPASTGYTASNFERLIFQEQLGLCKRHFFKSFLYGTAPAQNVGTGTGEVRAPVMVAAANVAAGNAMFLRFAVSMRTVPAITLYNPAATNAQVRNISGSGDHTATATDVITRNDFSVTSTGNAGGTVGNISGIHAIADAGI